MNLLGHLSKFFSKHIVWVAKVGRDMLDKKGLPVEYYANHVVDGNVPLDSLGILCIARNWYIHIAVFLKNGIWTTRHDNSLEGVEIYLAFVGGVNFVATIKDNYIMQDSREVMGQNVFDLLCTAGTNDGTVGTNNTMESTKETISDATSTKDIGAVNLSTKDTTTSGTKDTGTLNLSTKDTTCGTNETNVGPKHTKETKKPVKKRSRKRSSSKKGGKNGKPPPKKPRNRSASSTRNALRSCLDNPYARPQFGKSKTRSSKN